MNMCVLTASSHWFGCCCGGWMVHSRYMSFPVESAFCFFFLSISFVSFNFKYKRAKFEETKKKKRRKEVFCNRFLYIIIIILKKINKKENKSFFSVYLKII